MLTENQPAILVVDDDEKNLYSLKEILLELDVEVQAVSSGEAALKAIVNQEFFLILMGVCMPGMDGFETVALIRGNENYRNTPVIFVTAQSEKLFLDATYREGVVDIIFKPIVYPYAVICKAKVFLELYLNKKELEQRTFELERKIAIQHKAQQALLVKEQDEWEILNSMVDAVIIMDEAGNIISFNKMAKTLFGYCFDEIIGQNINRLMPESDVGRYDAHLHYHLNTSDARVIGSGLELNGLHKNKQIFPMRLSLAELPANEVGKRLFIGTCQDLTQIKQQQEQMCRAQRMDALGKLTEGIAHDYNNMLGVIIGYSEMLQRLLADQPKLADYASRIRHAGERGTKLTKKLLLFSREEALEASKLDINTLLQDQQDMLQKTLTMRIKLLLDLADELWPVWLEKSDLEEAILNMSINAMHAMNNNCEGAQLTISTCNHTINIHDALIFDLKAGDYVQLSLTDTGVGMDEAIKEKIFDPFFSTREEKGTGLGLSQVFGFVKRAGGTIKVYSEPGSGSQFVLNFPRYIKGECDKATETSEDVIDLSGSETILIVDDDEDLRDLNSDLLSSQDYQVFCAEDAKQALQILEHEHIDLILSDVIMTGMSGYQLASIVQEKYPAIKIQLTSGFSNNRHIDGVDLNLHQNLLIKPYDLHVLLKHIRALLDDKGIDVT